MLRITNPVPKKKLKTISVPNNKDYNNVTRITEQPNEKLLTTLSA